MCMFCFGVFFGGVVFCVCLVFLWFVLVFVLKFFRRPCHFLRGSPERCNFGLGVKAEGEEINLFAHICLYLEQLRL